MPKKKKRYPSMITAKVSPRMEKLIDLLIQEHPQIHSRSDYLRKSILYYGEKLISDLRLGSIVNAEILRRLEALKEGKKQNNEE